MSGAAQQGRRLALCNVPLLLGLLPGVWAGKMDLAADLAFADFRLSNERLPNYELWTACADHPVQLLALGAADPDTSTGQA